MEDGVIDASFDVVIVGAGSSGCALASPLSEKKDRRVLLRKALTLQWLASNSGRLCSLYFVDTRVEMDAPQPH